MIGERMDAYAAYSQEAATTASPAQLVLMLYDGALARIEAAVLALGAEPVAAESAHTALTKAQAIVHELTVTLDHEHGDPLAANLANLYGFCMHRLLEANVAKDAAPLSDVIPVLRDLRDAWEQGCVNPRVTATVGGTA